MVQDCNKPWYRENYIAFFEALRYSYPHLRLIANCDMGEGAPTDLYDWHIYTGAKCSLSFWHTIAVAVDPRKHGLPPPWLACLNIV